jgi:ribosomal protein S18 acetylase RimI-like enzyme
VNATLFTVRQAVNQDATALAALEQLCVRESEIFRGSTHLLSTVPPIGEELDSFQADPHNMVIVVESSGEICGFAQMEISETVAMIRRVFVSPNARELGAGATLIDELRSRAKLQRCTRIDAYALPGDRLTKNLFERAGMKARLLIASSDL